MRGLLQAFRYREGDTLLHRLDPRAKLVVIGALVVFLWLRPELPILALALLPLAVLAALGRLGRALAGALPTYLLLALVLVPLNALLHAHYGPGGVGEVDVLLRLAPPSTPLLGELLLTREGLTFSLVVYLRLALMLAIVSVFVLTTDLDTIEALLYRLRVPPFFVLTLGFAFRFLPTLAEEAERIREAQRARGLDLQKGGPIRRTWNALVPLLFPLVVSVLRRSLRLAEALETRGTFAHPRRTVLTELRFRTQDTLASLSALGCLGASVLLLLLWPVV